LNRKRDILNKPFIIIYLALNIVILQYFFFFLLVFTFFYILKNDIFIIQLKNPKNMEDQTNTISLDEAKAYTQEWRNKESTYNSHQELNAFLIPAVDLQEALDLLKGQEGKTYVRAYIGVKHQARVSEEKLVIVATIADEDDSTIYRDLIYGKVDGIGATTPPSDPTNSGIFDFTYPCPTFCDPKSPIHKG
jgi:hypothetical protein